MSNICLIGCVKMKRSKPCAAVDMYISPLFRLRLRYAQKLGMKCYIISAKYGLLEPQTIIAPYNATLKDMTSRERKMWAIRVIQELERREKIGRGGRVLVLAGKEYRQYLARFYRVSYPFGGMKFGQQLKQLNREVI